MSRQCSNIYEPMATDTSNEYVLTGSVNQFVHNFREECDKPCVFYALFPELGIDNYVASGKTHTKGNNLELHHFLYGFSHFEFISKAFVSLAYTQGNPMKTATQVYILYFKFSHSYLYPKSCL